jgi:hypothetical protein
MDTKSKTHEANPQKGFVVQINASENFGLAATDFRKGAISTDVGGRSQALSWCLGA